jgi:hypothetical protein
MNRALAVCLPLRLRGVDARIVTNSPFAEGLAQLAKCPVVRLLGQDWASLARAWVDAARPRLIVTDTFPYGLRDEWRSSPPHRLVHVARRLRTPSPLQLADFALVIQAEPLGPGHAELLGDPLVLPGPIRLAPGQVPTPVPPPLERDGLTLVVHSGPEAELATLAALAGGPYIPISPWSAVPYYPAVNLYPRAHRILTGAGYNSMADSLGYGHRHTAVAFARTYDDQAGRLSGFFTRNLDGTPHAVEAIESLL